MIKTVLIASFIAITAAVLASPIGFVSATPEENDSLSIPGFQNAVILVTSSSTTGPPQNPGGNNGNSDPPANPGPPESTPGNGIPRQDPGPPENPGSP